VAVVVAAIAAAVALLVYRNRLLVAIEVQYNQWQCLHFERPPGTVAFDADGGHIHALAAKDPSYQVNRNGVITFTSVAFANLMAGASPVRLDMTNIIFMHERVSPKGHRRLVMVQNSSDCYIQFLREALIPAPWFGFVKGPSMDGDVIAANLGALGFPVKNPYYVVRTDPEWRPSINEDHRYNVNGKLKYSFQIFFGQPDQKDPSHFTIAYQIDNQPGVIDGWLDDDEHIRLEAHGPWAQPVRSDDWGLRVP
jgi:hypothetical protein